MNKSEMIMPKTTNYESLAHRLFGYAYGIANETEKKEIQMLFPEFCTVIYITNDSGITEEDFKC